MTKERGLLWSARVCFFGAGLILILLSVLETRACGDTLDAFVVTSAAADLATTEWALAMPGTRESNPMMQERPARFALKAVGTALVLGGSRHLERRGHRGWSKGLRIAVIALWGGAAVSNAIRARGQR